MAEPLPDADLGQIEQRVMRALDAAAPPWIAELETRAPIGGCSFIRFDFVARAPEDIMRLITEVRRLRG